jgi:hypothetical protein
MQTDAAVGLLLRCSQNRNVVEKLTESGECLVKAIRRRTVLATDAGGRSNERQLFSSTTLFISASRFPQGRRKNRRAAYEAMQCTPSPHVNTEERLALQPGDGRVIQRV